MTEPAKPRAMLITFEGIECAGKGTQIALLMDYLRQHGIDAISEHEPGGTLYGEALRAIIKHPEIALPAIYEKFIGHSDFPDAKELATRIGKGAFKLKRTPECEFLLFSAARAEFANKIRRLIAHKIIISDRLADSSTAYQGGGHGLPLELIEQVNRLVLRNLWPDLTFFLDIPVTEMFSRVAQHKEKNAFFEEYYNRAFFERVRRAYLTIAETEPNRFLVIDGSKPIAEVFEQIRPQIDGLLGISHAD